MKICRTMMTHSYYGGGGGGGYDPFYRGNQRQMSHATYYDRVAPYSYYDQPLRHNNRSEYVGRPVTRTMIHEPDDAAPGEQRARKRISVAVKASFINRYDSTTDGGIVSAMS